MADLASLWTARRYELLTGSPRAPEGFCPPEGRWIVKMEKGWLYMWVLYWTITTMTTIGYADLPPSSEPPPSLDELR